MKLRFTKMQGVGNDFVVLDGVRQSIALTPRQVQRIADRHFGIGCDQLLLVEPPAPTEAGQPADFRYRIFNADGGEVEQCGNGARCFVRFVIEQGLSAKTEIRVQTVSGVITPRLEADGQVTVDMGAPVFEPAKIPFDVRGLQQAEATQAHAPGKAVTSAVYFEGAAWPLDLGGGIVPVTVVSMGNPHAVQFVDDVEAAPVTTQGPLIEHHARFPQRVNAGYAQVLDRHHIRLRVWERGAGETLACGTGACAAVVAGISRGLLDSPVRVTTHGGDLDIRWEATAHRTAPGESKASEARPGGADHVNSAAHATVRMTGPAVTVFVGEIEIDE